jgi:hypothetical protein
VPLSGGCVVRAASRKRAGTVDPCGLWSKGDVSFVHSDEMICILRVFAAAMTNDPGFRSRVGGYWLYGSVTK